MVFFLAAARAADPSPATFLPSAVPVDAGEGELSFTAAHYGGAEMFGGGGGAVRLGVAPTDRLWVEAFAAGLYDGGFCGFGFLGGGGCTDPSVASGLSLSARYNVYQHEAFSVAPILLGGGTLEPVGDTLFVGTTVLGGGIALEGGSERVRFDLSLVGLAEIDPSYVSFVPPVFVETGLSFRIGHDDRHTLRVGVTEIVPEVSWRYEADRWFVEAGVVGIPILLGAERIEVGVRF